MPALNLEDVFKLSGVPTYTFVQPVEYNKLIVALRTPGRGVVIEGPSGIGKTTAVIKALDELGLAQNALRLRYFCCKTLCRSETWKHHCGCVPQRHSAAHDGTDSFPDGQHECKCPCRSGLYGLQLIQENNEMRKVDASVAIICLACLIMLFMSGGSSLAMAEEGLHLTPEQAITAARRNARPENSFTILWKIIADADTRRIADQALEHAQAHKIELYENGILVDILRSGGYLLAETNLQTNNVVAMHLVLMEAGGAVKDVQQECHGVVRLADAEELVKDTAELVKQMYSTPSTEESSLASRFYGGNFPDADQFPDSLFAIPDSLRKPGAKPNEVREAAALFWGYLSWPSRSALSMPAFAASPAAAGDAAEKERDTLKAEFLQSNKLDPNINLVDFDNIQNERQLQERIELLTRLDRFLEDSLRKEADPAVVRQNLSILTMPLRVDVDLNQEGQYVSSSPPKSLFLWHRLATGGFAVKEITWDR